jgi:serine/threonine protein kinase
VENAPYAGGAAEVLALTNSAAAVLTLEYTLLAVSGILKHSLLLLVLLPLQVYGSDGNVTVLRANCRGVGDVAIKCIPAERAADLAATIQAETTASSELPASFLLLKPLVVRSSPQGALLVSQFGGDSWQHLFDSWQHLFDSEDFEGHMPVRVEMAGDMLACVGLALKQMHAAGYIHRDIKLGNIVYDCKSGTSRLIDCGISVRSDLSNFFVGYTFAYLDPAMAQRMPDGRYAFESLEGQAAATSPAGDIWALCLVALQVMMRGLPDMLDYEGSELCQLGDYGRLPPGSTR